MAGVRRAPGRGSPRAAAARALALVALAAPAAAAGVLVGAADRHGVLLVLLMAGHVVVTVTGLWLVAAHRGAARLAGAGVVVAAEVATLAVEIRSGLLWTVLVVAGLLALAAAAGTAALRRGAARDRPPELCVPPPRRPFVIMNPKSGDGKVARYGLRQRAEAVGARVVLLDGAGVDVAALARGAVADGADLLGVAGGDGTQALVAGVAADSGVPLLVVAAGTRNHFAADLGLDPADPGAGLEALSDGVELRVDLGDADGRPFVNNVSFGAYGEVVRQAAYRGEKLRTSLDVLPDLLVGHRGPWLTARAGSVVVTGPQALLISNNPYAIGDLAGLGRRPRLDRGVLGVVGVRVGSVLGAVRLLGGRKAAGITVLVTEEVVVESAVERVHAAVDGEGVLLRTPVRCRVRPGALRVRVPRRRPGPPAARPPLRLAPLLRLALPPRRAARGGRR